MQSSGLTLGINAYHADSSAAILLDGEVSFAVEEERIRRVKHWAGFPSEAIRMCISNAKVDLNDVSRIAINRRPRAQLSEKMKYLVRHPLFLPNALERLSRGIKYMSIHEELKAAFPELKRDIPIDFVDHHTAHVASVYLASECENAAFISVDGFGDFLSSTMGILQGNKINRVQKILFPHSLGIFYQALTQYLGFWNYGDEYKVMGLAPYGKPNYRKELRSIVALKEHGTFVLDVRFFRHVNSVGVNYEVMSGEPKIGRLWSKKLELLLGPARGKTEEINQLHADIAASVQCIYEETLWHMLRYLFNQTGSKNLCFSGGCGQNSVANGKIAEFTEFENVYLPPAAGDAGGALGAAYYSYFLDKPLAGIKRNSMARISHITPYLGPDYNFEEISSSISSKPELRNEKRFEIKVFEANNCLYEEVAYDLARGLVVGWFQGKMEFGPRALGNRSILVDPRNGEAKKLLNEKIKRRESFRPFAPSILQEFTKDWFCDSLKSPYMEKVVAIRPEKQLLIPAVTHIDGTGRLHTVTKETNEKYYGLIEAFYQITNVPILLNTSFNENEPIVMRPEEALDCFLRTEMDILVLDKICIKRKRTK